MEFWSKSPVQLESLAIVHYFYTVLCAKRMVQNCAMCTLLNFFFITNLMPFSVNREGSNLRTFPSKNDLQISGSTSGSSPINYKKKKGKIMHSCHSWQLRSWAEPLLIFTLIKDITEIHFLLNHINYCNMNAALYMCILLVFLYLCPCKCFASQKFWICELTSVSKWTPNKLLNIRPHKIIQDCTCIIIRVDHNFYYFWKPLEATLPIWW